MKKSLGVFVGLIACSCNSQLQAQSSYASSNYATSGDTLYLTSAQQLASYNYDSTGAGITWNYAGLTGLSQQRLIYRLPTQAGFTNAQWHYLYVPTNVNLSSTNGQTIAVGSLQYTNPNDYYLINSGLLEEKASSFNVTIGSSNIAIKNVYTTPDVLCKFPLNYGNADSSTASYNINIPNLYYKNTSLKRVNHVYGWGTIVTPYGTFSNALKVVSNVMEIDSIRVDSTSLPKDTIYYRELKWFDASKTYPVLYVKQNKVGNNYVTQTVQYLDNQQYFQPHALFAYLPAAPITGDTVTFQNLSTNSLNYLWNFNDASIGVNNTSTLTNPQHIFTHAGTYSVTLIAYNGPLSDTFRLPVVIDTIPSASFIYSPATIYVGDTVHYTNTSINANSYKWFFGDVTSGNKDSSALVNPTHVYNTAGTYTTSLIAYSIAGKDTTYATIIVNTPLTTSINNINADVVSIYPNPASGSVSISVDDNSTISISNALGQIVYESNNTSAKVEVNVTDYPAGIYYVNIHSVILDAVKKLIIQK
jgi:PKD repeat protein